MMLWIWLAVKRRTGFVVGWIAKITEYFSRTVWHHRTGKHFRLTDTELSAKEAEKPSHIERLNLTFR